MRHTASFEGVTTPSCRNGTSSERNAILGLRTREAIEPSFHLRPAPELKY